MLQVVMNAAAHEFAWLQVLSIIGAITVFVTGHWLFKWWFAPVGELKDECGKIAYSLLLYANRRYSAPPAEQAETRRIFRAHAAKLQELANRIHAYWFWGLVLRLPPRDNVFLASAELIGHSNFPDKPDGTQYDNSKEIRDLLALETTDDAIKRRVAD